MGPRLRPPPSHAALAGQRTADQSVALMSLFFKFRSSGRGMECGVAGYSPPAPAPAPAPQRSPARQGLHVNFSDKGEVKERREKFLTAKYGSHQMALIRKRLAVEMWLYDALQQLYEPSPPPAVAAAPSTAPAEVDIDELLDMESDDARRRHLTALLSGATKPEKDVNRFINDLLEKAKTL